MVIDTHVHIRFPEAETVEKSMAAGLEWFLDMLKIAESAGIDKLCIIGESAPRLPEHSRNAAGANAMLLRLLEEFPEKLFGYARINPNKPHEALREMERCFKNELVIGVKVGGGPNPWSLKADSPEYQHIMGRLLEHDRIMLMHAWHKTTGNYEQESTPFEVAVMAQKYPRVKIQMAHLSGANCDGVLAVAPHENIFVDYSGGFPEAGFLEWAVEVLGPGRIVFGSDAPGRDFSVQMAKVLSADIDKKTQKKILGENIKEILGARSCSRGVRADCPG